MSLEEARKIICDWLNSTEPIADEWKIILPMCIKLIDDKLKVNNNDE